MSAKGLEGIKGVIPLPGEKGSKLPDPLHGIRPAVNESTHSTMGDDIQARLDAGEHPLSILAKIKEWVAKRRAYKLQQIQEGKNVRQMLGHKKEAAALTNAEQVVQNGNLTGNEPPLTKIKMGTFPPGRGHI